jgi:NADPH-dependent 2,4-dienoyl-CoA reductase/sulfur reductase-like enzyme
VPLYSSPADRDGVLIVGGSAAGTAAAVALRRENYPGRVTILTDERGAPYDRPPLSKQFLAGRWEREKLQLLTEQRQRDVQADWLLGVTAVELDADARLVRDSDGRVHAFDQLVVATGLRPRRIPGLAGPAVHVLRTVEDSRGLRSALAPGARVTIIGGGFLGLEVAATCCALGARVTVIEPLDVPLGDKLGARAASALVSRHRAEGVDVRTGTLVTSWATPAGRSAAALHLGLSDGSSLAADVVVVAIGASPCTQWLQGSGLPLDDGLVCDEFCQAAPGVWGAGDVARWLHVGAGRSLRLEHRTNATAQGQAVAAGIAGRRQPYSPVPFFWTDHYNVRIQVAGFADDSCEERVVLADTAEDKSVTEFHAHGGLTGVITWNAPKEMSAYRRELSARAIAEVSG